MSLHYAATIFLALQTLMANGKANCQSWPALEIVVATSEVPSDAFDGVEKWNLVGQVTWHVEIQLPGMIVLCGTETGSTSE